MISESIYKVRLLEIKEQVIILKLRSIGKKDGFNFWNLLQFIKTRLQLVSFSRVSRS